MFFTDLPLAYHYAHRLAGQRNLRKRRQSHRHPWCLFSRHRRLSATDFRHDRVCPNKPLERTHFARGQTIRHLCRGRSEQTMVVYPPETQEPFGPTNGRPASDQSGDHRNLEFGEIPCEGNVVIAVWTSPKTIRRSVRSAVAKSNPFSSLWATRLDCHNRSDGSPAASSKRRIRQWVSSWPSSRLYPRSLAISLALLGALSAGWCSAR